MGKGIVVVVAASAAAARTMQNVEPWTTDVSSKPCQKTAWLTSMLLTATLLLAAAVLIKTSMSNPGDAQSRRLADGWPEGEPAFIAFVPTPNKCWKARGPRTSVSNGQALVMWDCQNADKFIVPSSGFGMIKLERDKRFCLNAPGGAHTLQIWRCNDAPRSNVQFSLPIPGKVGMVKPSNQASVCVDVPGGDSTNGRRLQQWDCNSHVEHLQFIVRPTSRCVWATWDDWSECQFCKKKRVRKEMPHGFSAENVTCHAGEREIVGCETPACGGTSSGQNAEAKNGSLTA